MVFFNAATKELNVKIVYYGPGLSGKTSNLQHIYGTLPEKDKGKMLSLATSDDRTLFFDFLPLELGQIQGMKTRVQLYTVPGQVFYNTTRKLVLRGCDGVVFVADSQKLMLEANKESLENLRQNLLEQGDILEKMPLVIQYNKRDLQNVLTIEELRKAINKRNVHDYEAIATEGKGVFETLKEITKITLKHVSVEQGIQLSIAMKEDAPIKQSETPTIKAPVKKDDTAKIIEELMSAQAVEISDQGNAPRPAEEKDTAIRLGWDKKTENVSLAAEAFKEQMTQSVEKQPEKKPEPVKEPKAKPTLKEPDRSILETAEDLLQQKHQLPKAAKEIKVELSNREIFIDQNGIRVPIKVVIPKELKNVSIRLDMQIIHLDEE